MRAPLVWVLLSAMAVIPSAVADDGSGCPEQSIVIGQYERHTVTVQGDCTVDIVLNEGIVCLGGGVGVRETELGLVHVTQYYCTYPGMPPADYIATEHIDIFVPELTACTWTGSYKPYLTTPWATVWVYSCDPET